MTTARFVISALLVMLLCGPMLRGIPAQAKEDPKHPRLIHLYARGPRPQQVEITTGTPVVWVSHLDVRPLVVVSVIFPKGRRVAKATTRVKGINGFVLQGPYFIGRMAANGGEVGLRFLTPGEYTYTIDLSDITGKVVVR